MNGSRNFRQGLGGGGPGKSDKKALKTGFFSPQLILLGGGGGATFSRGGGPIAYSL